MIFPEGMGMEMALFQQALFLFTLLEVLLPNRNEPQTTINSQIGHTHTNKQTGVMTTLFLVENHVHHDAAGLDLSLATLQCLPATSWQSVCKIFVPTRVLPTITCRRDKIRQNLNRNVVAKKECEVLDSRHMAT